MTAMQAIGYKEMKDYLEGVYPYEEAVRLIKRNTRRYAKRRFTWFKKEENICWVEYDRTSDPLSKNVFKSKKALLILAPEIFPAESRS